MAVLDLEDLFQQLPAVGATRLRAQISRTVVGSDEDLRSQVHHFKSREMIIAEVEETIMEETYAILDTFEDSERASIGPYSIQSPWSERAGTVTPYFHQTFEPNPKALEDAVTRVQSMISRSSLTPDPIRLAFDAMPRGGNAGLPWLTRDKSVIGSYLDRALTLDSAEQIFPAVAGWRGQPSGLHELPKQRLIWMFDHAETILGLTVLHPVLDRLRSREEFVAWNNLSRVDDVITSMMRRFRGKVFLSSDFSGFDSSVPGQLIDAVFEVLRFWFIPEAHNRLNILADVFKHVGLVTPDGVHVGRTGGVPSGSALTNLVDSLVNIIVYHYLSYCLQLDPLFATVLGDDSIFIYGEVPPPEAISECVGQLGLTMNAEKQLTSDESVHYLQRVHSYSYEVGGQYVGVRPIFRALNGIISYERRRNPKFWNRNLAASRTIMQLENTSSHPNFRKFVEYIAKGDRMLLEVDPVKIFANAGGSDVVGQTLGIEAFRYTSRDPSAVESFGTTSVLRSMRGR